jgi:catechol 2,3-dioxygenase-like lactoylglutathione lyase family enzyme
MTVLPIACPIGFSHIVMYVRDVERSRDFYEAVTLLQTASYIVDLEDDSYGYVLKAGHAENSICLHLVRRRSAALFEHRPRTFRFPGFTRLCFKSMQVEQIYARLTTFGGSSITGNLLGPDGSGQSKTRPAFATCDPDGNILQFITLPREDAPFHVSISVQDLDAASRFFRSILGLTCYHTANFATPQPVVFDATQKPVTFRAALFAAGVEADTPMADIPFTLDVVQWTCTDLPAVEPEFPSDTGIARLGIVVTELDHLREMLAEAGVLETDQEVEPVDLGSATFCRLRLIGPGGAAFDLLDSYPAFRGKLT